MQIVEGERVETRAAIVRHVSPIAGQTRHLKIGVEFTQPAAGVAKGVSFELSAEQGAIQAAARRFADESIRPVAANYDRSGEYPWDVVRKAFSEGFFTGYIPKEYGGSGWGLFETALITEELGAGCMAMGTSIMVNLLGVGPLLLAGTDEQKARFLKPYCERLSLYSFCFTEPDAGSDPSRIATRAEKKGAVYVLNGSKCFITNGAVADYYVIFATLDPSLGTKGITAFVVSARSKGIRLGKALDKMGQRAANANEIFFENLEIPEDQRLGQEGGGYKVALSSIARSRINVAAGAVGIARSAWEHALRHVQKRIQFDQPLAEFQYVKFRLADLAREIDAARLLTWRAACAHDAGRSFAKASSMAKDFAGDMVMRVTSEALDLFGGYGYSKDFPMEKLMRDAKLMQLYEGPSPIHKMIVYRDLAKDYGF
ncbi:MAG: acyl-CoA dehydrogenase family protein [Nitrospirota bacterium]